MSQLKEVLQSQNIHGRQYVIVKSCDRCREMENSIDEYDEMAGKYNNRQKKRGNDHNMVSGRKI